MESYVTLGRLTLQTSSTVLSSLQTDNALQREASFLELGKPHWGLGSDNGARDPRGTAEVHPLVKSLRCWVAEHLRLIAVQEEGVVVDVLLLPIVDELVVYAAFWVTAQLNLEVILPLDYHVQTQVLVF